MSLLPLLHMGPKRKPSSSSILPIPRCLAAAKPLRPNSIPPSLVLPEADAAALLVLANLSADPHVGGAKGTFQAAVCCRSAKS